LDSLGHQTPQAETKQSSITKQTSSWISRGQQDDRNQWISQTNQSTKFREEYYDFPQLPHAELQTIHFSLRTHPCANSPSSLAFLNISSINSLLTVEQRIEAKLTRISQRKYTPPTVPVASLGQPCTWNLVLMTSSGHTNVAATTPAEAPATAWHRSPRAEAGPWWWWCCCEDEDADEGGGAGEVAASPGISLRSPQPSLPLHSLPRSAPRPHG